MTSRSSHAFCTLAPVGVAPTPSIVVMARLPIAPIGNKQERTALPSRCTVQAPHCAIPQPNFVPVIPKRSRSTQSSGISAGASTVLLSPLIVNATIGTSYRPASQHVFRPVYCARVWAVRFSRLRDLHYEAHIADID